MWADDDTTQKRWAGAIIDLVFVSVTQWVRGGYFDYGSLDGVVVKGLKWLDTV